MSICQVYPFCTLPSDEGARSNPTEFSVYTEHMRGVRYLGPFGRNPQRVAEGWVEKVTVSVECLYLV